MSNLTSFALASIFSLLSIWGFYFLIKKWSKFHLTLFGKVFKLLYALTLLLTITVSLTLAYNYFNNYWVDDRVRVVNEFQGVQLGWSKDEVLFRKGEPASVDVDGEDDKLTKLAYGTTVVWLENDKVVIILYVCQDDNYSYEKVGGISCYSDVDRVTKQYGESKDLVISEDKLSRIYNYPKYNLAFRLSKSKVEELAIFDSIYAPNGVSFSPPPLTDKNSKSAWENAPIVPETDAEKIDSATDKLSDKNEYVNPTIEDIENVGKEKAESQKEWKLVKPANKNIDYEAIAKEYGGEVVSDETKPWEDFQHSREGSQK